VTLMSNMFHEYLSISPKVTGVNTHTREPVCYWKAEKVNSLGDLDGKIQNF
jgi:hypothetical protein